MTNSKLRRQQVNDGIGRRVGLKHRCWKTSGFDPRLAHQENIYILITKHYETFH